MSPCRRQPTVASQVRAFATGARSIVPAAAASCHPSNQRAEEQGSSP